MQPFQSDLDDTVSTPAPPQSPRVLQPISSEADILREAAQNTTSPVPVSPPVVSATPTPTATSTQPMYTYESNLASEPLHPVATTQIAQPPQLRQAPIEIVAPKKSHLGAVLVVCAVVLVGLGLAGYWYVTKDRVAVADLVNADVQSTSYLHPKQWKSAPIGISGFGDMRGTNGKSSQLVGVTVSPNSVGNVTSAQVDSIRPMLLDRINESTVGGAMQNGDRPCTSAINLQKEADTSTSETTIGLYNLTATCQRSDGTFLLKMHGVVGKDGYVRTIGIAAPQELWKTNQQAYQKMLDSLQQKNAGA